MAGELEIVQISALEHFSYCPRQYALIYLEQDFSDNIHTLRGQAVHELVDMPNSLLDKNKHIERALPLFSKKYGLVGKADIIERFSDGTMYPIEYKHGKKRKKSHDALQLAAQALCLARLY